MSNCNSCNQNYDSYNENCNCQKKGHVHEIQGSVFVGGSSCDPHNHRFSATTGEPIPTSPYNHVHEVKFKTDTYEGHEHEFCGRTCEAIQVGDRHVHYIKEVTDTAECHAHEFRASTLLEEPISC